MLAILGRDIEVAEWVSARIGATIYPPFTAIGFDIGNTRVAGAVFNDYMPGGNIELTVAADRVPSRAMFRVIAGYVFGQLGCSRISIHTLTTNSKVRDLAMRVGFKPECVRVDFYGEGKHAALYYMLRRDCPWMTGDAK